MSANDFNLQKRLEQSEGSESVFKTGNFSAKYIRKDILDNNENTHKDNENTNTPPIDQKDTIPSQPISFKKVDPMTFMEDNGNSRSFRRESLLSASISRSVAARSKKGSNPLLVSVSSSPADALNNPKTSLTNKEVTGIVERHLPGDDRDDKYADTESAEPAGTNYSTMKSQGGFLTRDIENWVQDRKDSSVKRVASFSKLEMDSSRRNTNTTVDDPVTDLSPRELVLPGGFRRNFLAKNSELAHKHRGPVTQNFFQFLALYGHFAGQDLREDDESEFETETETEFEEDEEDDNNFETIHDDNEDDNGTKLLHPVRSIDGPTINRGSFNSIPGSLSFNLHTKIRQSRSKKLELKNKHHDKHKKGKASTLKAFLLLLKAFLGTGVIFLPKGFSNGGLLFCNVMIVLFSLLSYYCFIILINTTKKCGVSGYGDAGLKIYGGTVRTLILLSLVLSQMGFASSYVVFVGANFKELYNLIWEADYTVGFFILLQLTIFVPLSLTRKISKLGFTALIADAFIFMGLVYIYSESTWNLIENGISEKVALFNSNSWSLFIGTAVFAYEGIGLLIPIQESMKEPQKFDQLLILVMGIVTIVFTSLASISYLSYGDDVKTVILMNFPRNSITLTVQLCYALAILLSAPLQIFPAIKIIEHYLFHKKRGTWKERIRRNSEALSLLSGGQDPNPNYDSIILQPPSDSLLQFVSTSSASSVKSANPNLINQEGLLSGKSDVFIKTLKNVLRVVIIFIMTAVAYLGSNHLDKFVSLVGSFTCIPLIYIYPPMLYWGCFRNELRFIDKFACGSIFIMGCGLMVYTSYDTIKNW